MEGRIVKSVDEYDRNEEYYFLGYSMGCLVAIEVYLLLAKQNKKLPKKIILCSSSYDKNKVEKKKDVRKMDTKKIIDMLTEYGGTPPEILANQEILEFFMPQIRADFIACNEYDYDEISFAEKILSKGIVLFGSDEFVSEDKINGWNQVFKQECEYHMLEGGHFFIHEKCSEMKKYIVEAFDD